LAISLSQFPRVFRLFLFAVSSCCLAAPQYIGTVRCLSCHAAIGQSYQATAMARSSGNVDALLTAGEVRHRASGTRFVIDRQAVRFGAEARPLRYFLGSGAAGRSFLTERNGFLFLTPLTWYAATGHWDMSPG